MYRVTADLADGKTVDVTRSRNYRLAKRRAMAFAHFNPTAFFGVYHLFKDGDEIEEGEMIQQRMSWEKREVPDAEA